MATINGIFSTKLRGKVGDVVYRVNGQTNTVSQKPSSVSNPKSLSQQLQRMYMATAAIAYSQMKAICDHSFEGVSGKQGNQAEFLRRNVRLLSGMAGGFNLKGNQYLVPNYYLVSKGSLNGLNLETISYFGDTLGNDPLTNQPFKFEGIFFKSSVLNSLITKGHSSASSVPVSGFVGPTVREFCDAFGINYGSQITFLINYNPINSSEFEYGTSKQLETRFKYCRIVLKADKLDQPLFQISTTTGENGEGNIRMLSFEPTYVDTKKSQNWDNIRIVYSDNDTEFGFAFSCFDTFSDEDGNLVTGMGVCGNAIISYNQDGKWLRSTEKLLMSSIDVIGERDEVVQSYSPNDPKYLNNATPEIHVGKV